MVSTNTQRPFSGLRRRLAVKSSTKKGNRGNWFRGEFLGGFLGLLFSGPKKRIAPTHYTKDSKDCSVKALKPAGHKPETVSI